MTYLLDEDDLIALFNEGSNLDEAYQMGAAAAFGIVGMALAIGTIASVEACWACGTASDGTRVYDPWTGLWVCAPCHRRLVPDDLAGQRQSSEPEKGDGT